MVRALGIEPSPVRVKGPVPYQTGVARISGPGGNRTPCVGMTAGLQPTAPHGATDPRAGPARPPVPTTMPLQLSKSGRPGRLAGASKQARKESNPRPAELESAAP